MEARFYVYQYFDSIRNEPIYIGKGTGNRCRAHLLPCELKKNLPFYNRLKWILKQEVKPVVTILNTALSEIEAHQLENFYILSIGRKVDGTGPLLNLTEGGEGASGHKQSLEHIAKRERTLAERGNRAGTPLGSKYTEERKRSISAGLSSAYESGTRKRKTCVITSPDGQQTTTSNLEVFCNTHGLDAKNMRAIAHGKRKTHRGYTCAYAGGE